MEDVSFKKSVFIPFGQSLGLGLLLGAACSFFLRAAGKEFFNTGFGVSLLTASIMFWALSLRSYGEDKAKMSQSPRRFEDTIRVTMLDETDPYTKGWYVDLEVQQVKLILLAREMDSGKAFTLASFGGRGKLLSRSEYEMFRDRLVEGHILAWRNPGAHTQGVDVTYPGRAFFKHYARKETKTSSLIMQKYERYVRAAPQFGRACRRA